MKQTILSRRRDPPSLVLSGDQACDKLRPRHLVHAATTSSLVIPLCLCLFLEDILDILLLTSFPFLYPEYNDTGRRKHTQVHTRTRITRPLSLSLLPLWVRSSRPSPFISLFIHSFTHPPFHSPLGTLVGVDPLTPIPQWKDHLKHTLPPPLFIHPKSLTAGSVAQSHRFPPYSSVVNHQ